MAKKILSIALKVGFIVAAFALIFRPETFGLPADKFEGITPGSLWEVVRSVDPGTAAFWFGFALVAKLSGILAGILRWRLLLRGQDIADGELWRDTRPAEAPNITTLQGEFLNGEETKVQNSNTTYSRKNDVAADSWQRSPVYYYGYNDSIFVRRVHDVLSAIKMVKTHPKWKVKKVSLLGQHHSSHWAAAAGMMAGKELDANLTTGTIPDREAFSFNSIDNPWDQNFVPGAAKYGGVSALHKLQNAK